MSSPRKEPMAKKASHPITTNTHSHQSPPSPPPQSSCSHHPTSSSLTTARKSNSTAYCSLSDICRPLVRNDDPNWTLLTLNCMPLGYGGSSPRNDDNNIARMQHFARALLTNSHIQVLFLNQTQLHGATGAWNVLARALAHHATLHDLYLCYNPDLGDAGVAVLAQALMEYETASSTVNHRSTSSKKRTAYSSYSHGPKVATAKSQYAMLSTAENTSRKGCLDLASGACNTNENESHCGERDAQSPPSSLCVLKLAYCGVRDAGCQSLSQWLSNNDISGNTCSGGCDPSCRVSGCQLTTLDMQQNDIGPSGFCALVHALQTNSSLKTLNVENNPKLLSPSLVVQPGQSRKKQNWKRRRQPLSLSKSDKIMESRHLLPCCPSGDMTFCPWRYLVDNALGPQYHNTTLTKFALASQNDSAQDNRTTSNSSSTSPSCPTCSMAVDIYLTLNRWGRDRFGQDSITPWVWSNMLAKPHAISTYANHRANKNRQKQQQRTFAAPTVTSIPSTCPVSSTNPQMGDSLMSSSLLYYLVRTRPDLLLMSPLCVMGDKPSTDKRTSNMKCDTMSHCSSKRRADTRVCIPRSKSPEGHLYDGVDAENSTRDSWHKKLRIG